MCQVRRGDPGIHLFVHHDFHEPLRMIYQKIVSAKLNFDNYVRICYGHDIEFD